MLLEMLQSINYIYESLPSIYNGNIHYIWLQDNKWKVQQSGASEWTELSDTKELYYYLQHKSLDLDKLESLLYTNFMNQGLAARLNLRESLKFVTEEDLDKHEQHWKDLASEIEKMIISTQKKSMFSIIKDEDETN